MNRRFCAVLTIFIILFAFSAISIFPVGAKKNVKVNKDNPHHYRKVREGLYEGIYIQEVSSWALGMVSLTTNPVNLHLKKMEKLDLQWSYPQNGSIEISIKSLRPKLYYRVDATKKIEEQLFSWNLELPLQYSLKLEEIGILGYIEKKIESERQKVYVPMILNQGTTEKSTSNIYLFKVLATSEVNGIFYTLDYLGEQGNKFKRLEEDQRVELPQSYNKIIPVKIPFADRDSGFYSIIFSFEFNSEEPSSIKRFFYHVKQR